MIILILHFTDRFIRDKQEFHKERKKRKLSSIVRILCFVESCTECFKPVLKLNRILVIKLVHDLLEFHFGSYFQLNTHMTHSAPVFSSDLGKNSTGFVWRETTTFLFLFISCCMRKDTGGIILARYPGRFDINHIIAWWTLKTLCSSSKLEWIFSLFQKMCHSIRALPSDWFFSLNHTLYFIIPKEIVDPCDSL